MAQAEQLYRSVMDSPLGPLTLIVSSAGARGLQYGERPGPAGCVDSERQTALLARQLREYFSRRRRAFDLPLDLEGTAFQRGVWRALGRIPYGQTASYGAIARALGKPRAFRAVGQANRRNPLPIIVPCHRVIGADGSLTGYSGPERLDLKRKLLELEGALP